MLDVNEEAPGGLRMKTIPRTTKWKNGKSRVLSDVTGAAGSSLA